MKIGILADTHNHVARTKRAMEVFIANDCDVLLHCGDLANLEIVALCSRLPFHFVIGNHDNEAVLKLAAQSERVTCHGQLLDQTFGSRRIMMTHGHRKESVRAIESERPDYFLCGHSHVACDRVENGIRKINPGALYRTKTPSVAILNTEDDGVGFFLVSK